MADYFNDINANYKKVPMYPEVTTLGEPASVFSNKHIVPSLPTV